jgi:hypothetical protein
MRHPLEFVPGNLRKPFFFVFLALTLLIFGVFKVLDAPLGPGGIVSFELARTVGAAQSILTSWDSNARVYAAFGLGLDYLFMPVYAFALSFGILLLMNGRAGWYLRLAAWMGWGGFAAALFDAVENYALWKQLIGGAVSPYPGIAVLCASIKFALLVAGLLFVAAGGLIKKKNTEKK